MPKTNATVEQRLARLEKEVEQLKAVVGQRRTTKKTPVVARGLWHLQGRSGVCRDMSPGRGDPTASEEAVSHRIVLWPLCVSLPYGSDGCGLIQGHTTEPRASASLEKEMKCR